ncbi:MAG: phosphate ABC transporter ATP-binding protein [Coriobacteriaceae bacterium]|uniref:phosphate ABC transporter ATP-binding protein n=1 Tax=Tractidigestivibacter sp. TaxID=2847320 RepID=UPI002A911501|nr:phosphate ABC transporter ATP-binding protein [Tractidigestivibacter sp.]MCI6273895.1 phosphate ABC transporter ATP-binding protein [Coriobacteriaceae bacterium]MCI7439319.1 phosphate ABC transporter ATP-binding protein [Coriobacteriaceae bacterium]MDD7583894.1 phosphate ABC transporter ATP-binding protein [Coriobacteriaceae bacterium]MDY5272281.1 phosphate ABC transporter ATP-binding protein [Tractidigestivibacter sp.]
MMGGKTMAPATAARDTLLHTSGVTVRYDYTHEALHPTTLAFEAGTVTALIGPSGCGKSTYLRCLNLMNREIPRCVVEGEIRYHGHDVNTPDENLFELRKSIGMVFQQPTPFRKSIRENILFAPRRHGRIKGRAEGDELVETSLRQAALWDEVKDKLGQSGLGLSGGQQQRLCIARTLAMRPDVVLFDEPCSALDPISTYSIEETIRSIAQAGICCVIVTHNMEQATRVSDRTAFFYVGDMVETGATKRIFSAPKDQRLADYLSGRFG